MGSATCRATPPACTNRSLDECAVGVPGLALASVRVLEDGRRHRWDTGEADARDCPGAPRAAVAEAYGAQSCEAATYAPDAAIVNLYPEGARLGLHQDYEEPSDAPVVTISLGDTCTFRLASVDRRTGPFTDVELRSGDLLVLGRSNRRIFHGVPNISFGTAADGLGLPDGRLSITVRETGFS